MSALLRVHDRMQKLQSDTEAWKAAHDEAMEVLDLQDLVDRVLVLYNGIRTHLCDRNLPRSCRILGYQSQLELLAIGRRFEADAQIYERMGYTIDAIDQLRHMVSELHFTEESIREAITSLDSIPLDDLIPAKTFFADLCDSTGPTGT